MNPFWMDRLGSVASATCAAHCLLFAALPSLISLLGLHFLAHEAFEWGFFILAVSFALAAGVGGYRNHRNVWLFGGFAVGILVLITGRLGEALELYEGGGFVAIAGGSILVASHLTSLRRARQLAAGS